jgi:hypothetical protein
VELDTLHPVNLFLSEPVVSVFDVRGQKSGQAGMALHKGGNYATTVFDAVSPSDATAAHYFGLLQGGF